MALEEMFGWARVAVGAALAACFALGSVNGVLGDQAPQAQSTPDAALTARFDEFLTDVLAGRLPASGVADEFRKGFTRERIALVDDNLAPLGAFQTLRYVGFKSIEGYSLYHYDAVFANGMQKLTFFLDPSGSISGFLTGYA
ncbi:MAG: hypothetical protein JO104_04970 [Candidatus Eremiobacteraeota bacterium]|nr:hypothetical protein [Candidatus Eremiobacteraeota bacterium]